MMVIKGKERHLWFDSMEEMEKQLPQMWRETTEHNRHVLNDLRYRGRPEWYGCYGHALAEQKIREGWPELLMKVQPMVEALRGALNLESVTALQIEVRRRKRHRADYGDTLDMHRVWGGQLDTAWERPVKVPRMSTSERYATIYCDTALSSYNHFDNSLWRAAAALVVVDVLTRMGINTEVWTGGTWRDAFAYTNSGLSIVRHAVRVKEFTQPLNEDRFAAMFSAAFCRTWDFYMHCVGTDNVSRHMGYPMDSGLVKPLQERKDAGERVFRFGNCIGPALAEQEVKAVLSEIGMKEVA